MSSRERPGFENRIAEILADELGAELTVHWTPFGDEAIERTLHRGECDAVIGIGESVSGVESTVPFLRAPYTFVTRADSDVQVASLDDPALADLTVGTYQTGLPSIALRNRGLEQVLREYAPVPSPSGPDRHTAILDAVIAGEVDIAIVYGPHAAGRELDEPGTLRIVPVTPETDLGASIIQMFRIWTIGVRPGDIAFQDRLNVAMSQRWDDIQAAIQEYNVQGLGISRPPVPPERHDALVRVGAVLPMPTRHVHPFEAVGESARLGVALADNYIATLADRDEVPFEILIASAPSGEAASRAAERLVATEDVQFLIGGYEREQAVALTGIAAANDVVFLNVGVHDDQLRDVACYASTLHVAPSASMYLNAAVQWHAADAEGRSWFLVYDAEAHADALVATLQRSVTHHDPNGSVVGVARTRPRQFVFMTEISSIREANADIVILALGPDDEDQFLAQFDGTGIDATITSVPDMRAQSRRFLERTRQAAPLAALAERPVAWDATLQPDGAGDINDRYASRTGQPMEAASWTAYAAVRIAFDAARAGVAHDPDMLAEWLAEPGTSFSIGKGNDVRFLEGSGQLHQPIVMIRIKPEAEWGSRLTPRLEFAEVVGMVDVAHDLHVPTQSEQDTAACP